VRVAPRLHRCCRPPHDRFPPYVYTKDTALRIYEDVYRFATTVPLRVITTVDVYKAFDMVPHSAILHNFSQLEVDPRMFYYARAFLSNRTVEIQVDAYTFLPHPISRAVPQGSTPSPMLFNMAMIRFPTQLQAIPTPHHNIYADDVTV
ncbi:hypothetical protein HPB47_014879, partial [Ixodes persulcatus]